MGKFWRDFSVGKIAHLDFAHGKISWLEIFPWEIFVGIFPWGKITHNNFAHLNLSVQIIGGQTILNLM